MIRHAHGNEFLLIAQDDHARFSGAMARRWGNPQFAVPDPFEPVVDGVAMHDAGWPLHDLAPTLNRGGLPLHVLETPAALATRVWDESVRLASERHAYSGLLVSLHVVTLSVLVQGRGGERPAAETFELNKFQHRQVERQEALRRELGLRTDRPLRFGLAAPGTAPDEDLLLFNYHLLKALDGVSLDVCSGASMFRSLDGVFPRPGAAPVSLEVDHPGEFAIGIAPWPFAGTGIRETVPARRVPRREYPIAEAFHEAFAAAPVEGVEFLVRPKDP